MHAAKIEAAPEAADAPLISPSPRTAVEQTRALRILAKSLVRELKTQGFESKHIVGLATELIDQVTTEARR